MLKKSFTMVLSSLILAAGLLTGCSDAFDVAAGGADGASGARAVSSGSQPNHYVEVKATSTSNWEQKNKFQFKLSNLSINSGDTVSFMIQTPSNATKLTVRGVSSDSKWIKDVSVSGSKWYSVSATATSKETEIGITVYCTAQSGLTVRIGDLKVKDTWIAANSLKGNVKEYYASPKSFSVTTNDSSSGDPTPTPPPAPTGKISAIGFRYSNYGIVEEVERNEGKEYEPTNAAWDSYMTHFANAVPGADKTFVFIVGSIHGDANGDDKVCHLRFNKPSGKSETTYLKYKGSNTVKIGKDKDHLTSITENDLCDSFLQNCTNKGYKVWLQVEAGDNDIVELASIVMTRFKNYPCVEGFGVDCEWWYRYYDDDDGDDDGKALSASKANEILNTINSISGRCKDYKIFAKHWEIGMMPNPNSSSLEGDNRKKIVYVDDSQSFNNSSTSGARADMIEEFGDWAAAFPNNPVVFQIGYKKDYTKSELEQKRDSASSSEKRQKYQKQIDRGEYVDGARDDHRFWKNDPIGLMEDIADEAIARAKAAGGTNKDVRIVWADFTFREFLTRF